MLLHGAGFCRSGARKGRDVSFGHLVALLVLLAAFVLYITGKMDGVPAAMFGGLALAIMLTAFPIRWGPAA